jgi:drug/metabolite transporter (DMT)-like permease
MNRPTSPGSVTSYDNKGIALILLSAASFGAMPIFAKLAYAQMDFPQSTEVKTVLAIRFCVAAVFMWLIWAWQRRGPSTKYQVPSTSPSPTSYFVLRTRILPLVALGALGYVGQSFSYFTAISIISVSATGLLLYTYPILVTIMARIFLGERLTTRKVLALALATCGTLMVLGIAGSLLGLSDSSLDRVDPAGAAWGIAAAVIYSVYIIAGTRFTAGLPPVFSSAVIISSAAIVYTVWGFLSGELRLDIGWGAWFWAVCISIFCTVLAIAAFFAGLSLIGPSRAAIASTVEPAMTVLLAALILQERITPEQIAGGVLVLSSVLILQWPSHVTPSLRDVQGQPTELP